MKSNRPVLAGTAILLLAGLIGGCSGPQAHLCPDFGRSSRTLFAGQVVNPAAPDDPAAPDGMPGYIGTQIYNEIFIGGLLSSESGSGSAASGSSK